MGEESKPDALIKTPVEIIPLGEAQLCEDCHCVTRAPNEHCLACGSHSTVKLSSLLNRRRAARRRDNRP